MNNVSGKYFNFEHYTLYTIHYTLYTTLYTIDYTIHYTIHYTVSYIIWFNFPLDCNIILLESYSIQKNYNYFLEALLIESL